MSLQRVDLDVGGSCASTGAFSNVVQRLAADDGVQPAHDASLFANGVGISNRPYSRGLQDFVGGIVAQATPPQQRPEPGRMNDEHGFERSSLG